MKLILTSIMVLALAFSVSADDPPASPTTFGVKAGLNIAGHSGDDTDEYHSNLVGAAFGGFFTYDFSPAISIQTELLYSMKGWEWDDGSYYEKGKTNYIEIPVLITYNIPMEGNTQPRLFVGPALGFLSSAEVDWEEDADSGTEDIKAGLKSTDFSLVFGGGVGFGMGEGVLTFDVRYTMGMSKIDDTEDAVEGRPWDIKNKAISFFLGYGF